MFDTTQTASAGQAAEHLPPPGQRRVWSGLTELAAARAIASVAERLHAEGTGLVLAVAHSSASARRLGQQIRLFGEDRFPTLSLPDWETLPYDPFSPHEDITSERLRTLHLLPDTSSGVLVVPVQTLLQRLPPTDFVRGQSLKLATGARFDAQAHRLLLEAAGYRTVDVVTNRGEYALRGSLMDIFPSGLDYPVRIDLFDDEIESLRYFDPDTQRTVQQFEQLELLPAKEYPFDAASITRFRDRWHNTFDVDVRRCAVYQDVSSGLPPAGVEYYLPFFFEGMATLFDYLPANTVVVQDARVEAAIPQFLAEVGQRWESLRHDVERPVLPPQALYVSEAEWFEARKPHPSVRWQDTPGDGSHEVAFASAAPADIRFNAKLKQPASALHAFLRDVRVPVLFVAESAGRRELLGDHLKRASLPPAEHDTLSGFLASTDRFGIITAAIDRSTAFDDFIVLAEAQLLGTAPQSQSPQTRGGRVVDPDQIVRNLTELNIGAPVVHLQHGIGRYEGLQTLDIDGARHEFLTICYADDARLYVPVAALHLISRYTGAEEGTAPLHRLGSDQWEKAKRRAAEKAVDVAAELLDIYARRALRTSRAFASAEEDYQRFVDQFPFDLTADQAAAIDAVLSDLASPQATDRLICGDVGFGKTEVAMRAAYVAVQNGAQVAVLVPTTLLATQHGETFSDRFADWPVRIEVLSRLQTDAEVKTVKQGIESGRVDIVIGTHKLLSDGFRFKDLGLVIIDEEHRFGVRQKERLKALRAEVDVLTLTATPIPRTLNMAMNGIRDLSIIATPPAKRLSIKTFVQERNKHIIREAINRELMRGGQVFYLHNEVRTIEETARELAELVPEARIGIGHGQMATRRLESVMSDFYHRQLNVLVCTTIIETGIDIPNANTIIIERADRFGLAQLHQLRGRVGRSTRQAYAYLLTPHRKAMTADAVKRLDAIEASGELGIGFTLATHDMEIRGAGELLGDEQSGQIESIGFSLYMELLDRAVQALRDGRTPDPDAPLEPVSQEVNLHAPTLIPDDYLPDVHTRLILYKRISNAATEEALDAMMVEMIDRFGTLPEATKRLFEVTRLKLAATRLGITRIDVGDAGGRFEFDEHTRVNPLQIVRLIQDQPATYRLDGATTLRSSAQCATFEARCAFAAALLEKLTPQEDLKAAS